ncbi:MAG: DNA-processing protein DprA [Gammaproteobacteria bacterium]|nr:DNA-processing protein DprA [Gammaproteobacteria bacterium]MDH4311263.1 DNA-processing protein DprA [Gammaproteobacteria bacterium]MDH5273467.1 DNA-processing protein DprA [Gammaproteobacteria bacterium]
MDDQKRWLALAQAPGLHAGQLQDWLAQGALPIDLTRETQAALASIGLGKSAIQALLQPDGAAIDHDLGWLHAAANRWLVTWGSANYPPLLAQIPDAPLVLYVEGDPMALCLPQLAIVGTRNPTALGRDTATQFALHLAQAGLAITSGLALGIDAAAHRGALDAGARTIAVLGRGLDAIYPRENESLALEIVGRQGALVTDLPIGTPPLKQNFPRRNRILSGLAVGTLVVEAALRSGSLITARLAADHGREVFAIPGSIHNPMVRGCHRLLRQGARLVESVDDIFAELEAIIGEIKRITRGNPPAGADLRPPPLDKEYEILLDALGFEPAGLDMLVVRTGLKAGAVASMLLILELEGRVQQQPGGLFSRRLPGKVQ